MKLGLKPSDLRNKSFAQSSDGSMASNSTLASSINTDVNQQPGAMLWEIMEVLAELNLTHQCVKAQHHPAIAAVLGEEQTGQKKSLTLG